MGSPPPAAAAIQELMVKGRDSAERLRVVLARAAASSSGDQSAAALVEEIMRSFSEAILLLSHRGDRERRPAADELRKAPAVRDRRGINKRRRSGDTWIKKTATPYDDGHAWRKYGQKEIHGSKHPRCYFRCSHRNDQGCEATKQVQQKEDEAGIYVVTYMGHHTCRDDLQSIAPIIIEYTPKDSYLLNFESTSVEKSEHSYDYSSLTSNKRENDEETATNLAHQKRIPGVCSSSGSQTSEIDVVAHIDSMFNFDDGQFFNTIV